MTCGASIKVLEDNQGTKELIENPLISARSKHIGVRFHCIRELFKARKISVEYVASAEQHADILTKALNRASFRHHRNHLMNLAELLRLYRTVGSYSQYVVEPYYYQSFIELVPSSFTSRCLSTRDCVSPNVMLFIQ